MSATSRVIASIATASLIATLFTACGDVRVAFDDAGVDGSGSDAPDREGMSLIVTPGLLVVAEGEAATFTVALSEAPAATVTVTLASTDVTAISAAPIQLAFEPAGGSTAQTVTVVGVGDADADDDHELIMVRASGLADATVAVTVTDDDALAVVATPSASLDVTEGSSAPLYLRLSAQPAAPVVVTAASGDPSAAAVAPAMVTFTSQTWNVDQAVVVSGLDDADVSHATSTCAPPASPTSPCRCASSTTTCWASSRRPPTSARCRRAAAVASTCG